MCILTAGDPDNNGNGSIVVPTATQKHPCCIRTKGVKSLRIDNIKAGISYYYDSAIDKQPSTYLNHYEDYKFTCVFKFIKTKSVIIGGETVIIGWDSISGMSSANRAGSITAFAYCNTNLTWLNSKIYLFTYNKNNNVEQNPVTFGEAKQRNYFYKTSLINYAAGNSNISYNCINAKNLLYLLTNINDNKTTANPIQLFTGALAKKLEDINTGGINIGYAQTGSTFNHFHNQEVKNDLNSNLLMSPEMLSSYYYHDNLLPIGAIFHTYRNNKNQTKNPLSLPVSGTEYLISYPTIPNKEVSGQIMGLVKPSGEIMGIGIYSRGENSNFIWDFSDLFTTKNYITTGITENFNYGLPVTDSSNFIMDNLRINYLNSESGYIFNGDIDNLKYLAYFKWYLAASGTTGTASGIYTDFAPSTEIGKSLVFKGINTNYITYDKIDISDTAKRKNGIRMLRKLF